MTRRSYVGTGKHHSVERGDRRIGQALEQLEFVHKEEVYDIEVDTHIDGEENCTGKIVQQAMKKSAI